LQTGVPLTVDKAWRLKVRFWHIADANTITDATLLTEPRGANTETPPVLVIQVPDK